MPDISIGTYLILTALMVIVVFIRASFANQDVKQQQSRESSQQFSLQSKADAMVQQAGAHSDAAFSSGSAVMVLDKTRRELFIATDQQEWKLSLDELSSVKVVDRSADYQRCQEMARLRKGVERKSLYLPYGRHSSREVKEGAQQLQSYTGQLVYGLEAQRKDGSPLLIAAYCGNGTLFWTEAQRLEEFRAFVADVQRAV